MSVSIEKFQRQSELEFINIIRLLSEFQESQLLLLLEYVSNLATYCSHDMFMTLVNKLGSVFS